jgi:hypothetical protein
MALRSNHEKSLGNHGRSRRVRVRHGRAGGVHDDRLSGAVCDAHVVALSLDLAHSCAVDDRRGS